MTKIIPIEEFTAIAAGKPAVFNLPVGPRYLKLNLELGNTAVANVNAPAVSAIVGKITLSLAGNDIWEVDAARLDGLNSLMGAQFAAQQFAGAANGGGRTILPLIFDETHFRKNPFEGGAMGIQTGWLNPATETFQLKVEVLAGITPFLSLDAFTDDFRGANVPHAIRRIQTHTFNVAGSKFEISNLPKNRAIISQLSLYDTSDAKTVETVEIKQANDIKYNLSKNRNTAHLKNQDLSPAAGAFHVVFDSRDRLEDAYPTVTEQGASLGAFIVKGTFSAAAAGTMDIVDQRVGLPTES